MELSNIVNGLLFNCETRHFVPEKFDQKLHILINKLSVPKISALS